MSEPQAKQMRHHDFEAVLDGLRRLRARGFFGTILLGMQNGKITTVEPKPMVKPGDPLEVWMP